MMLLGELLRHTRVARGISQFDLALELGVSQRHVSFVESGRARPSRDLILSWTREVGAPLSLRNAALLQAGFSPAYGQAGFDDARMAPALAALTRMLDMHEPFTGLVFDVDWIIRMTNPSGQWLASILLPDALGRAPDASHGLDMIGALTHPGGLLSRMRDPWTGGGALLDQLRSEQWMRPELKPRIDVYEQSLVDRFGRRPASDQRPPSEPCLNLVFDTEVATLSFFTIQSVFALPQDVTLASLRVELWFPADDATRVAMIERPQPTGR